MIAGSLLKNPPVLHTHGRKPTKYGSKPEQEATVFAEKKHEINRIEG
jgi:hypothetical protein